jgi:hypothetical protein
MKRILISSFVACIMLQLCQSCNPKASRAFFPLSSREKYSSTEKDSVQLYFTKLPERPYEELGILYLPVYTHSGDLSKSFDKLKQFAADEGAWAVIRVDYTESGLKGVAIRWK